MNEQTNTENFEEKLKEIILSNYNETVNKIEKVLGKDLEESQEKVFQKEFSNFSQTAITGLSRLDTNENSLPNVITDFYSTIDLIVQGDKYKKNRIIQIIGDSTIPFNLHFTSFKILKSDMNSFTFGILIGIILILLIFSVFK